MNRKETMLVASRGRERIEDNLNDDDAVEKTKKMLKKMKNVER